MAGFITSRYVADNFNRYQSSRGISISLSIRMAIRRYNKTDPETCRKKKMTRSRRRTFYTCFYDDISSIPNVERRSDRILKIRQYVRHQNKTYMYLLN